MWAKEDGALIDTNNDGIDDRVDRLFTGQMYDKESGLYYMNARYYDPDIDTFMTVDPAMSGLNHDSQDVRSVDFARDGKKSTYAYASANPIRYTDPTGMDEDDGGDWGGDITDDNNNEIIESSVEYENVSNNSFLDILLAFMNISLLLDDLFKREKRFRTFFKRKR